MLLAVQGLLLGYSALFRSEKALAPHSSILAWKIPWAEEPGGLQSMGSQRVGPHKVTFTFHFLSFSKMSLRFIHVIV